MFSPCSSLGMKIKAGVQHSRTTFKCRNLKIWYTFSFNSSCSYSIVNSEDRRWQMHLLLILLVLNVRLLTHLTKTIILFLYDNVFLFWVGNTVCPWLAGFMPKTGNALHWQIGWNRYNLDHLKCDVKDYQIWFLLHVPKLLLWVCDYDIQQ